MMILPKQKFWRRMLHKLRFLEIITMFLYSCILGHNIAGCLQGCMTKQKPVCYICVYATQYEEALGNTETNTALVYWEMKRSSKKESMFTYCKYWKPFVLSLYLYFQSSENCHSTWEQQFLNSENRDRGLWRGQSVIKYQTVISYSNVLLSLIYRNKELYTILETFIRKIFFFSWFLLVSWKLECLKVKH